MTLEDRTDRLKVLIDPRKKDTFDQLYVEEDATLLQAVQHLIRAYIEERQGKPWRPDEVTVPRGKRKKGKR